MYAPRAREFWAIAWPCLRAALLASLCGYLMGAALYGQSIDVIRGAVQELRGDSLALGHRLGVLEGLALERRITALEVKLDTVSDLGRALLFGVAGLCAETAIRIVTAGVRVSRGVKNGS